MSNKIEKILIIGGDERQQYLSEALNNKGFSAFLHTDGDLESEIAKTDAVILPMPLTRDGININSVSEPIELKSVLKCLNNDKTVFVGLAGNKTVKFDTSLNIFDYSNREELAIKNAIPTAEGVIKIAIDKLKITIFSSKILITGFGKTAKAVAKAFHSLGADVTICARKRSDLAFAETLSYNVIDFAELQKSDKHYDLLVNTVPTTVIDKTVLKSLPDKCILVEIASAPYGIDFSAASDLNMEVIVSGSLPGKIAPKTAGYIICEAICNIIKEENL